MSDYLNFMKNAFGDINKLLNVVVSTPPYTYNNDINDEDLVIVEDDEPEVLMLRDPDDLLVRCSGCGCLIDLDYEVVNHCHVCGDPLCINCSCETSDSTPCCGASWVDIDRCL